MSRFPGNIIKLPNVTPTQSSASGVWSLRDQIVAQRNNLWPFQRDPYFNYTTLLLQGNVPNTTGPQAMTQPLAYNSDASTNNFLVTPNGDVSPRPFSPYFGGNYSNYFDGSTAYLTVAANSEINDFGTGDFNIECWFYATSSNFSVEPSLLSCVVTWATSVGYQFEIRTGGVVYFFASDNNQIQINSGATTVSVNTWNHVAASRQSGTTRLFVNGTQVSSTSTVATISKSSTAVQIGAFSTGVQKFTGYMSNVRIVKGQALYTGNFTPPTAALTTTSVGTSGPNVATSVTGTVGLLTCQSNRFLDQTGKTITLNGSPRVTDNSPFVSTDFTTGAGYFDGGTDYLQVANNAAFGSLNGVDYTIEFWAYLTTLSGDQPLLACTSIGASGFAVWSLAGQLNALFGGGTTITGSNLTANQWNHIAIVRTSTNTQLYLNGTTQGTPSTSAFVNNTSQPLMVGGLTTGTGWNSDRYVTGYISGIRIIKSQALATGNFTPPTTLPTTTTVGWTGGNVPTQSITGTVSILTLQTRAASQNIGFIDSSPNEFIVTKNGNTTQGTFSPFSPTGWGNRFDGSSGQLAFPTGSFVFGNSDFTIEAWVYNTGTTTGTFFNNQYTSGASTTSIIGAIGTASANFDMYIGSSVYSLTGINPTSNQWVHVAIVRTGGTVSVFQGGSRTHTRSDLSTLSINAGGTSVAPQIGNGVNGFLSNHRIIIGSGPYDATLTSITVPTAPLTVTANTKLLTCQSNRFLDQTGKTITVTGTPSVQAFSPFAPATQSSPLVTGGSGYFDGSGDYLTVPSNPVFTFTGDFTWEGWFYMTANPSQSYSARLIDYNGGTNFVVFSTSDGTDYLGFIVAGTSYSTTTPLPRNQWSHVAVSRNGTASNNLKMFFNGTAISTQTNTSTITATQIYISNRAGSDGYFTGYMSSYRMTNTGLYTSNFPIPTAPPTAIPNTSLLLNFTNGGIVDATGKNNLETVANAQVSTVQAKWPPGSMAFNGASGTYLNVAVTTVPLGSGDFVVEGWVYLNASKAQGIFDTRTTNTSTTGIALYLTSGNAWQMVLNNAGVNFGGSITNSVWTHVAVVRTGSTVYLYVAGSLVNSSALSNNLTDTTFLLGTLRDNADATTTWKLNGYVDDFRITKGYNRGYTGSSITVPTGPFPIG